MNKQILLIIVILFIGVAINIFAQELQVGGDLKVQGTIDATNNRITNVAEPVDENDAVNTIFLRNSVQDNGPWEYKLISVELLNYYSWGTATSQYKEFGDTGWSENFETYLNTLATQGWYVDKINTLYYNSGSSSPTAMFQYTLKRKIED